VGSFILERLTKEKINDTFLLNMLEVDQAVFDGKKEEAVALLENMIPKLRGYKLLTAVQVRKHTHIGDVEGTDPLAHQRRFQLG
jgi:hypothetical protein